MIRLAIAAYLVVCASLTADDKAAPQKGIEGYWLGTLKISAIELRLGFKSEKKDGALVATMDSIDQAAKDIPVESADFADNTLTLKVAKVKAGYSGKLQPDGNTIKGEFDQGFKLPLELKRQDKAFTLNR